MKDLRLRISNTIIIIFVLINFSHAQEKIPSEPQNLDVKIFRVFNNYRTSFLDGAISITDKSLLPVSILTPAGFYAISYANKNHYDENTAVLCLLSEATGTVTTLGLKHIFKRKRPYQTLSNVFYNKQNSPTDEYSFPSGHSTVAFSIATTFTLRYPDKPVLISGLYLYALIISYGRLYMGVHYPSDLLGGALIGTGSAVLIYSLRKEIIKGKNNLFNQSSHTDSNQNLLSSYFPLIAIISADIINHFFLSEKTRFEVNATGTGMTIGINQRF